MWLITLLKKKSPTQRRKLNLMPRGIVHFYGFLAVLIVLIPEWIAEWTLSVTNNSYKGKFERDKAIGGENTEFLISSLNLSELRNLAKDLKILGYSYETRETLSKRLLKRLRKERLTNKGLFN